MQPLVTILQKVITATGRKIILILPSPTFHFKNKVDFKKRQRFDNKVNFIRTKYCEKM